MPFAPFLNPTKKFSNEKRFDEKICDRIGIINHGKLIFTGTMDELQKQHGKEDESLENIFLKLIGSEAAGEL